MRMPSMQVYVSRSRVSPIGQMMLTWKPCRRNVCASRQTRGSAGTERFSTSMSTPGLPIMHTLLRALLLRSLPAEEPSLFLNGLLVHCHDLSDQHFAIEMRGIGAACCTLAMQQRSLKARCQGVGIVWTDAASLGVGQHLRHIAYIGGNHRDVAGHRFAHDVGRAFRERWQDERIAGIDVLHYLLLRQSIGDDSSALMPRSASRATAARASRKFLTGIAGLFAKST